MTIRPNTLSSSGFSLVEVVLAVGIVAVAIPSVLGVMAAFSSSSSATMSRGEVASAANALELYLNGKVTNLPFGTVYGWVYAARQAPTNARVIYAHKANASQTDYIISQNPPTGTIVGQLLAAEILAPDERILPSGTLVNNSSLYTKSYLPINVSIHVLSAPSQPRTPATFVDSYPMVISK